MVGSRPVEDELIPGLYQGQGVRGLLLVGDEIDGTDSELISKFSIETPRRPANPLTADATLTSHGSTIDSKTFCNRCILLYRV